LHVLSLLLLLAAATIAATASAAAAAAATAALMRGRSLYARCVCCSHTNASINADNNKQTNNNN
jgi:hypothetical protein